MSLTAASAGTRPLNVVLCWHMHQPEYRDLGSGEFTLPWTYLHAIKDYADMAAHLEAVPQARAVVNFAPVLLDQLAAYASAIAEHVLSGAPLPDPLLASLGAGGLPDDQEAAQRLLQQCLRAQREHLIDRYPAFRELAARAAAVGPADMVPADLLSAITVWYHLAWLGESVRRTDPRVARLIDRAQGFDDQDRRELLEVIGALVQGIVPRYRRLAERGQVEIAVSPWGHPILPLLIDVQSAQEQMPGATLPATAYPGGADRARWHAHRARESCAATFGVVPRGCWPSEGAVSEASVRLLGEAGFDWVASGEGVLAASQRASGLGAEEAVRHRPFRVERKGPACFFRDDELSDRIGFVYSRWHGDDAVANFIAGLEAIAARDAGGPPRTVAVILDGENAWEHYPFNGYYFLRGIYERLAAHPGLRLTTFSDVIDDGQPAVELKRLVTGSWVHGSLSTWIGSPAKNRAFELLCVAKRACDETLATRTLDARQRRALEQQLAVCEGSDWAWWFADFNPAAAVSDFDVLYRRHLSRLYRLLGREPPVELALPIATGAGAPEGGGTMQRAGATAIEC
jgi:alpha-amylase/alpha-mannosidase (GH57 family)